MILQLLTACSTIVLPPAPLIIVGPGCQSTQLLTAKLAAAAGHRVQCVTRTADVRSANRLMYGTAEPPKFPPLFSCQNSQIASALGAAEGMILCVAGGKAPPSTSGIGTMMPYMPRVRRIVLLSAIGGSTGNTGGLGEGELILRCEEEAAATTANPNTPPSPLTLRKTSASPPTPSSQSAPQPHPQTPGTGSGGGRGGLHRASRGAQGRSCRWGADDGARRGSFLRLALRRWLPHALAAVRQAVRPADARRVGARR